MTNIRQIFDKSVKVIESCENIIQLSGGINYCHIFKQYCDRCGEDSTLTKIYYDYLIEIANNKINELS